MAPPNRPPPARPPLTLDSPASSIVSESARTTRSMSVPRSSRSPRRRRARSPTRADARRRDTGLPHRPAWGAPRFQPYPPPRRPAPTSPAHHHHHHQHQHHHNNNNKNTSAAHNRAPVLNPPTPPTHHNARAAPARDHRPAFKIPTVADIQQGKFIWIERLTNTTSTSTSTSTTSGAVLTAAPTPTTTTTAAAAATAAVANNNNSIDDDNDANEGWRGHPALILGRSSTHVHLLGTTSWGNTDPATKFATAHNPDAYTRWFVRLLGERDALPAGEQEGSVARLAGEMGTAFTPGTWLDCRSVRSVAAERFARECSRYFRRRERGAARREVWVASGEASKVVAMLVGLGGLAGSPWKVVDFGALREWREYVLRKGFRLPEEEAREVGKVAPGASAPEETKAEGEMMEAVAAEENDAVRGQQLSVMRRND